jgi:hypothetical protein
VDSVGLRVQGLETVDQVLTLARLLGARSERGLFVTGDINQACDDIGLPRPSNTSHYLSRLRDAKDVTKIGDRWKLTPQGLARSLTLIDAMDLAVFETELQGLAVPVELGETPHPVIPPWLAPPEIVRPLRHFLADHPFELNVFGMTRFPDDEESEPDPVGPGLDVARELMAEHGLEFHLASDRQIMDDLWPNVAAHIWGCKYGVAFFEDRRKRGVNYNLTIEVGSVLVLGRRVAILKDESIEQLPTDLTGRIYLPVNLDEPESVSVALRDWIENSLGL